MGHMVEFPSNGGAAQGYFAASATGSGPAVLVIQEWWGLVAHIQEVVDRFAIVGPPEEHVRRLTELSEAGVDQFNLYLMSGDEEAQLDAYGSTVIPALKAALAEA